MQVADIKVTVHRERIKNLYLRVLPPEGQVRVSAPKSASDDYIRLIVASKLKWIQDKQRTFQRLLRVAVPSIRLTRNIINGKKWLKYSPNLGNHYTLHWTLDMTFREDESRIRTGDSEENFAVIRHIALNIIKQDNTRKVSMKRKRSMAALDDDYRETLVRQAI